MRYLTVLFFLTLALGGLILGSAGFYYSWQIQKLANRAEPEPGEMSLVELLKKGPPRNVHVELKDFSFGEPLIDRGDKGEWNRVWIPLTASTRVAGAKYELAYFHASTVRNDADLKHLLGQRTLPVFVSNSLSRGSLLYAKPGGEFRKAHPKQDVSKVLFVTLPELPVLGTTLAADRLLAKATPGIGWGITLGLSVLSLVGFCRLDFSDGPRFDANERPIYVIERQGLSNGARERTYSHIPPGAVPPEEIQRDRDRLVHESPRSVHDFKSLGFVGLAGKHGILAALLLFIALLLFVVIFSALDQGQAGIAAFMAVICLSCVAGAVYIIKGVVDFKSGGVSQIVVCHSGLRWTKGKKCFQATWPEVLRCERDVTERTGASNQAVMMGAMFGLLGALAVAAGGGGRPSTSRTDRVRVEVGGEQFLFNPDTLSGYLQFCSHLATYHGEEARRLQFAVNPLNLLHGSGAPPKKNAKPAHLTDPRSPYYEGE